MTDGAVNKLVCSFCFESLNLNNYFTIANSIALAEMDIEVNRPIENSQQDHQLNHAF